MKDEKVIILIGAGRSGTTLLTKILNAHPEIAFFGETDFLVARLWREMWGNRFWLHWKLHAESQPNSSINRNQPWRMIDLREEIDLPISQEFIEKSMLQVGKIIRNSIYGIFQVDRSINPVFGYKEIWNGNAISCYDWTPYDYVFPNAFWIHLIRNPIEFAKSCAYWNHEILNFEYLIARIADWVNIIFHSRKRRSTGRFFEIKYEDLIFSPRETIENLLGFIEVEWVEDCLSRIHKKVQKSNSSFIRKDFSDLGKVHMDKICDEVKSFGPLCEELGYVLPDRIEKYFYKNIVR